MSETLIYIVFLEITIETAFCVIKLIDVWQLDSLSQNVRNTKTKDLTVREPPAPLTHYAPTLINM